MNEFKKNAFENIVWKMAAILSWPQCVEIQKIIRDHDIKQLVTGIILWMLPANERRRYIVTSYLIGRAHTSDPGSSLVLAGILFVDTWIQVSLAVL